jgi:hypothetical protein
MKVRLYPMSAMKRMTLSVSILAIAGGQAHAAEPKTTKAG